ncbi:MAG: LysM peptidoglycan-binding domain-containing protein [Anaerolineaceae bacterium]|nr:LysM peptidoglycan-binding domain-containing protein [Anaerolineaceae bacterium]
MTAKIRPHFKGFPLLMMLVLLVGMVMPTMGVMAQAGSVAAVNTGRLNVRTGPGVQFKSVTSIPYNTTITLIGRASKGVWVQVQLASGQQGWVNSTLIRTYADLSLLPITYNSDAPPPPTTDVPPPTYPLPGTPTYYVVKAGDDLKTIAARYGTTWQILASVNGLSNANYIYPGQRLLIAYSAPVPSQPVPQPSAGTHVVKAGETLASIAALYGTSPSTLAAVNGITNVNLVYAGQVLKIPAAPRYYTVQAGDTLATIATKYGVTIQSLVTANNITNINLVKTGQKLLIP